MPQKTVFAQLVVSGYYSRSKTSFLSNLPRLNGYSGQSLAVQLSTSFLAPPQHSRQNARIAAARDPPCTLEISSFVIVENLLIISRAPVESPPCPKDSSKWALFFNPGFFIFKPAILEKVGFDTEKISGENFRNFRRPLWEHFQVYGRWARSRTALHYTPLHSTPHMRTYMCESSCAALHIRSIVTAAQACVYTREYFFFTYFCLGDCVLPGARHHVLMFETTLTAQEVIIIKGHQLDREAARIRAALALTPAQIDARAEAAWAQAMDNLKNGR